VAASPVSASILTLTTWPAQRSLRVEISSCMLEMPRRRLPPQPLRRQRATCRHGAAWAAAGPGDLGSDHRDFLLGRHAVSAGGFLRS